MTYNNKENSVCFQYCLGNEPYIQYGCIIADKDVIDAEKWQAYIQKCLQHFFNVNRLLKETQYLDIELYDTNIIVYDHRVVIDSKMPVYGDYNLYIDVPNNYYVFNGHKSEI